MTEVVYSAKESAVTIMTSELDSLANDDREISTTIISNDGNGERQLYGDFELSIAATSSRTGTACQLFILPEINGDYPYGDGTIDPDMNHLRGAFNFDSGATAARRTNMIMVSLPNADFKCVVKNQLGVAFASSGNVLRYERYSLEAK